MNKRKKEVKTVNGEPPETVMNSNQKKFYNSLIHNSYPVSILTDNSINALDRELLSVIYSMVYNTGKFFQNNNTIADEIGVSKKTVISSLQRLKSKEYINYAYFKKGGHMRRYITSINYDKLKALNKKMENNITGSRKSKSSKPTKSHTHKSHKTNSNKSNKLNNSNKPNQKPLTTNQKQQIKKAIHIIGRNVASYNPKHLKNHFTSEYQNGKLNFSKLEDALIKYQYNKMNNMSIPKPVGYICAITRDSFNENKVNKMKEELEDNKNSDSSDNKDSDDFDYDYGVRTYYKISRSPKLCKEYYKKYGIKYDTMNKKDIKKLIQLFHIDFNLPQEDFMDNLEDLGDEGKVGQATRNRIAFKYVLTKNKKGK